MQPRFANAIPQAMQRHTGTPWKHCERLKKLPQALSDKKALADKTPHTKLPLPASGPSKAEIADVLKLAAFQDQ